MSENSVSSDNSSGSESSVQSANHAPFRYKRRRRIYERIKRSSGGTFRSLATVPEGQILKSERSLSAAGFKVVIILFAFMVIVAVIKEGIRSIQLAFSDGDPNSENEVLRRRKEDGDDTDPEIPDIQGMPVELKYLASTYDPFQTNDRALFWHIPRSGGATVKQIAAHCFELLMATEAGAPHVSDEIKIITDIDGGRYVNIDPSNPAGIDHASELNTANIAGLNFVSTPFLYDASQKLFGDLTRGRMFSMLRHPVDRAASLYYLLASDPSNGVLIPGESLEDYARSDRVEKNWMTRFLSNGQEDVMTLENLAIAKQVLKHKCLVGLLKFKVESMQRFETYFGWTLDGERMEECHTKALDWNWPNKNKHLQVREGTEAWRLLSKNNELDMRLYKYAEELFQEQGRWLFSSSKTTGSNLR